MHFCVYSPPSPLPQAFLFVFEAMVIPFKKPFYPSAVHDCCAGWMYGSLNGIVGLFPEEYVRPLARHEVETSNMKVMEVADLINVIKGQMTQ